MTLFSNVGTVLVISGSFLMVATHVITLTICPQMTRGTEKRLLSCGSAVWIAGAALLLAGLVGV
jgi:hypothetical protein